jgi:hypothetical protein
VSATSIGPGPSFRFSSCTVRPRLAPCDQSRHLSIDNLAAPTRLLSQRARVRPWLGVYETFATPRGPRLSNAAGVPRQAFPRDHLSAAYRDLRRRESESARAQSLTKQTRAHDAPVQLVATHGTNWLIEDCNLTAWAKLWGKSLAAFAPGHGDGRAGRPDHSRSGHLTKGATGPTALSSHSPCERRAQKGLAQRVHIRGACGFSDDRDLVSAALGTCVTHIEITDLTTARGDYTRAGLLLATITTSPLNQGRQDALTSQTHPLVAPRRSDARDHGARSRGSPRRITRHNARRGVERDSSTAQSTKGPGSPGPAKAAHELALSRPSPEGTYDSALRRSRRVDARQRGARVRPGRT